MPAVAQSGCGLVPLRLHGPEPELGRASKAPAADNGDKAIKTSFYTFGGQYMVNRRWTVMAELPIYDRALTTTDDGTVFGAAGSVYTGHIYRPRRPAAHRHLHGLFAGHVHRPGLGVKLPTGDFTGPKGPLGGAEFDRDSLPGTGSTDIMVSGYHVGSLSRTAHSPISSRRAISSRSRPRTAIGRATSSIAPSGFSYDFGAVGPFQGAPVVQLLDSYREQRQRPERRSAELRLRTAS